MGNLTIRLIMAISFFLLMILSGIWLRRRGKPYNKLIFTLHKIMTLLNILFVARYVILLKNTIEIAPHTLTMMWLSLAFFVVSFISGALLSFEKPMPDALTILHRISALLVTILTGVTIYLVMR
jgi:hypothetical protein